MLLYHYTDESLLDDIRVNGLIPGKKNPDTVFINEELMKPECQPKFNRNNCLFFFSHPPKVKDGAAVIEVDTNKLDQKLLYVANFYYADSVWIRKRHSPHKVGEILESAKMYWDEVAPITEFGEDFDEEEEYEFIYLEKVPSHSTNLDKSEK